MRTDLGLGGRTPSETNLVPTTGDGRCNKSLRRITSVWTIRKSINGSILREKD
jgi:hypothetical protein